jgi:hypothetical protein
MSFKVGDWIKHPKFGAGMITAHDEPYFVIHFVTEGEKRLQADFIKEAGSPPSPDFCFPEATRVSKRIGASPSKSKKPAHSFEHFVERFLALYPNGFEDAGFVRDERDYKLAAIRKLKETLNSVQLDSLLAASDFAEICRRAKQVASSLNLIFPQEMMSLNDSLKVAESQKEFALSLRDVLFSDSPKQERFERYFAILGKIGCSKWTVATYFQFLESAGTDMVMKPMVSQAMASAVSLSLLYRPEPNWNTCVRLNEVAAEVESRLKAVHLIPRDWVDLQSFMYVSWQSSK